MSLYSITCAYLCHLDNTKVALGADFSNDERVKSIVGDKNLRELLITAAEGVFKQLQFSGLQVLMLALLMHLELLYSL